MKCPIFCFDALKNCLSQLKVLRKNSWTHFELLFLEGTDLKLQTLEHGVPVYKMLNVGKVHRTIFKIFLISNSYDILIIVFIEFSNVVQLF